MNDIVERLQKEATLAGSIPDMPADINLYLDAARDINLLRMRIERAAKWLNDKDYAIRDIEDKWKSRLEKAEAELKRISEKKAQLKADFDLLFASFEAEKNRAEKAEDMVRRYERYIRKVPFDLHKEIEKALVWKDIGK